MAGAEHGRAARDRDLFLLTAIGNGHGVPVDVLDGVREALPRSLGLAVLSAGPLAKRVKKISNTGYPARASTVRNELTESTSAHVSPNAMNVLHKRERQMARSSSGTLKR